MSELIEKTEGQLLSEEYGVGGPPAIKEVRPLAVIEAELDMLKHDTQQKELALLSNYIEIGRRLVEAKAQLPHGEWGAWLKKKEYSQSTANNFMLLFREYGSEQQSLWGAQTKSQTFEKLTYSKALKLLALPTEEERERFMSENDVEHMSVRELNEALKARDEAQEAAVAAQEEAEKLRKEKGQLQEQLDDQARGYEAKLTSANVETEQAQAKVKAAQEAKDKAVFKAAKLQDALSEANASAQAAEEEHARLLQELEELRNRPIDVAVEVDTEAVEAAREAAVAEMMEKVNKAETDARDAKTARKTAEVALVEAKRRVAELEAREPQVRELTPDELQAVTADAVEKARAGDLERVKALEKQLASADGDVAAFRVHYEAWQDHYNKLSGCLAKITGREPERAEKLRMAVKAAVERMTAG